ncbi:MAG: nitroreductase [Sphingomonadales bacterium]|nr:nitroreductase [Sphingomonadales bacterium]
MTTSPLTPDALDQLFRVARTHNGWTDRAIPDALLQEVYELAKWAPTAANSNPARFMFVRSAEGKARLLPHINPGNVDKVRAAPCTVIIANDPRFYDMMPKLFPSRDMKGNFVNNPEMAADTESRNATLQGAYFIIAARALGLDVGPMSGFNKAGVDQEFFANCSWRANFLCNIGYGSDENLFDRNPRLDFSEACLLV